MLVPIPVMLKWGIGWLVATNRPALGLEQRAGFSPAAWRASAIALWISSARKARQTFSASAWLTAKACELLASRVVKKRYPVAQRPRHGGHWEREDHDHHPDGEEPPGPDFGSNVILTLLLDPGPGGKLNTDLEGQDDKADEAAVFAGIQGTVGCPAVGAWCDA